MFGGGGSLCWWSRFERSTFELSFRCYFKDTTSSVFRCSGLLNITDWALLFRYPLLPHFHQVAESSTPTEYWLFSGPRIVIWFRENARRPVWVPVPTLGPWWRVRRKPSAGENLRPRLHRSHRQVSGSSRWLTRRLWSRCGEGLRCSCLRELGPGPACKASKGLCLVLISFLKVLRRLPST